MNQFKNKYSLSSNTNFQYRLNKQDILINKIESLFEESYSSFVLGSDFSSALVYNTHLQRFSSLKENHEKLNFTQFLKEIALIYKGLLRKN